MAWIFKRGEVWWIATRADGRLVRKSTDEYDEAKARQKLASLEMLEAAQRAGRLNREFFEVLTGSQVEVVRLFDALDQWVKETIKPNTRKNYEGFAKQLKAAIPGNPPMAEITHEQIRSFLAKIRAEKRASTATLALGCSKAFFGRFKGAVRKDPTDGIPRFKQDGTEVDREAFTPDQIRRIMAVANPAWQAATALAFCTGLRLSDVALLKVGCVDLVNSRITVARTVKTGATVSAKLPPPVLKLVKAQIRTGATGEEFIWPEWAKVASSGNITALSRQFGDLLIEAKIRKKQAGAGLGKTGLRNVNALSFHSLRHAIVSALANAGVNQQVVKQLVGHASDRINDAYTHIGQATLDKAASLLPDITKPEVTK